MNTPEIHIEELKKDPEFLANIARLEVECKEEESIAKGYQLLDAQLVIEADEDDINEIFTFIVNTAFDRLAEKLTNGKDFVMTDSEDIATARAIYEHGIQRYSENDKTGAKEIFLILHYTIAHARLKDAMMIHASAVMAGHRFEDFIENLVDVEGVDENDPLAFFIQSFSEPIEHLLSKFAKEVKKAKKELHVLEASKS
jgi:hypothetical protein